MKRKFIECFALLLVSGFALASSSNTNYYVFAKNNTNNNVVVQLCDYGTKCPDFSADVGAHGGNKTITSPQYPTFPVVISWHDMKHGDDTEVCTYYTGEIPSNKDHKVTIFYNPTEGGAVDCCVDGKDANFKPAPCQN